MTTNCVKLRTRINCPMMSKSNCKKAQLEQICIILKGDKTRENNSQIDACEKKSLKNQKLVQTTTYKSNLKSDGKKPKKVRTDLKKDSTPIQSRFFRL